MPHGNYDNFYPTPRPKNIVLAELGLRDDLPIVSCLGMLRNYKGLNVATEAISLLGDEVQFLCAGKSHPSFDLVSLQNNIMKLNNALLIPRFINNQEFADYVSISNLVLMPYNRITGSGALLAVLTLGRGVVASDLPYFREILGNNSDAGMLVASEDPTAFAENIRKYLIIPANKSNQAARFLAERYEWSKVVPPVVEVIKNWGEFSTTS
jgi:glycosyltransferase involved in cell wall biosynthesis